MVIGSHLVLWRGRSFICKFNEIKGAAIYDVSDKNHSNRNYIASVWKKTGEELNTSGEFYVIIINYYKNISMVTNYKITSPQRKLQVVTV
jgi:hypothetical protein